jgi:hypothetical protein
MADADGRLERAVRVFTRLTSGIRAPAFWRVLYGTLFSGAAAGVVGIAFRVMARRRGDSTVENVRDRLAKELVRSGWPHHSTNWRNLHASRFLWRAYQSSKRMPERARTSSAPRTDAPLRVGVVGALSLAFAFPPELFAAAPSSLELVYFDIPWAGERAATYLGTHGAYSAHLLRVESWRSDLARTGRAIGDAGLDVLLVLDESRLAYDLLDHVECPCVVDIALGAGLLYHSNVSFHVHAEREADYFVSGERMFCGTTRRPLNDDLVFPGWVCYDARGIDPAQRRPWKDRDPLIVFHGALYKANSAPYLDGVFELMHDDADLEFVLMGDAEGDRPGRALAAILDRAERAGLSGRVHYDGEFRPFRDEEAGEILDPGWRRLCDHLAVARLAPNPWPVGGAASRVEAYLSGVPVPHLGVRTDPASWGRPQHGGGEIPILLVEATTVWTPEEYLELSRRLLCDEAFAELVIAEQLAVAARATDRAAYWQLLLDCYRRWASPS